MEQLKICHPFQLGCNAISNNYAVLNINKQNTNIQLFSLIVTPTNNALIYLIKPLPYALSP